MANIENLKPIETLSKEEAKKRGSKGGKASVKARRERKAMKEQLEILLKLPLKNEKLKKQIADLGVNKSDIDNQMAMTIALYQEAMRGNTKAYELIRDTIGEKPIEQVQNLNPPIINIERPK